LHASWRVSVRATIMIGGQRIRVGLHDAGKTAEVTIETDTCQITVENGITITASRTTGCNIKTAQSLELWPARQPSRP
jgi:hypothetical protein